MSLADYYDASYPPELWAPKPPARVGGARQSAAQEQGSTVPAGTVLPDLQADDEQESGQVSALVVGAGAPGVYSPAVSATDRPRNVGELIERATPMGTDPWAPGEYVPVGERGKRAHWDGDTWRSGEAPPFQTRARRR